MKIKFLTTIIILLISNIAFSQSDEEFLLASTSIDGTDYYVYLEKTNYDGSKEIWVKNTKPIKSIKNKKGKIIKTGGEKNLTFMKINCSERKYNLIQTVVYNRLGNVTSEAENFDFDKKIIPGSVMSGIYDFICSE